MSSPRGATPWRRLTVAACLAAAAWCSGGAAADGAAKPPGSEKASAEVLLRSARIWRVRGRSDLARAALQKLLKAEPNHSRCLLKLGLLEIHANRYDDARAALAGLVAAHPQHPDTRELRMALRISTEDRLAMATVRRQLQSNRTLDDGIAGLEALYPDGPPTGPLGIEYYDAIGRIDARWDEAYRGLRGLIEANPNDPAYRLAMARLLMRRDDTLLRGLRIAESLLDRVDVNQDRVMDAFRDGVLDLPPGPVSDRWLAKYLERKPGDQAVALYAEAIHGKPPPPPETPDVPPEPTAAERIAQRWADRARVAEDALHRDAYAEVAAGLESGNYYRASVAARPLIDIGAYDDARRIVDDVLALDPANANAIGVRVESFAAQQRFDDAHLWLDQLEVADEETVSEVRAELLDIQAEAAAAEGARERAAALWERSLSLDPGRTWVRYALAREWVEAGRRRDARALALAGVERAPGDPGSRYAAALILSKLDDDAAALAQLEAVPGDARSEGMRAMRQRLVHIAERRRAKSLLDDGDTRAARRLLADQARDVRGDSDAMRDLAGFWLDAGRPDEAVAVFGEDFQPADAPPGVAIAWAELQLELGRDGAARAAIDSLPADRGGWPADRLAALADVHARLGHWDRTEVLLREAMARGEAAPDRRLDLVDALVDAGTPRAARAELRRLEGDESPDRLLAEARRWVDLGELRRGFRLAHLAVQVADGAPETWSGAGELAERADQYDLAAWLYEQAGAAGEPALARERLDALGRDRRHPMVEIGVDLERKPGGAGVSSFAAATWTANLRVPLRYSTHLTLSVEPVRVEAGRLPAAFDDAAEFGTVAAIGPDAWAADPRRRLIGTDSLAVGVSIERDTWQADLGVSPGGPTGRRLVGGIETGMDWGETDVSLALSRRPVTSSVVSYVGARDPVSGRTWGGVVETALDLRLARDWGRLDAAVSPRLSVYEGTNVPDNHRLATRATADYLAWESAGMRLFTGLSATTWFYDTNQRFYTFGHGGYYSPQRYLSLSLPVVDLRGRRDRLSWRLRALTSHSWSREDTVALFPTDTALQTAAADFVDPVNEGGAGNGFGVSMSVALAWRPAPRWELGLRGALDRSDFYEPNFFQFYLRHEWNPDDEAPSDPPDLVTPYSRR